MWKIYFIRMNIRMISLCMRPFKWQIGYVYLLFNCTLKYQISFYLCFSYSIHFYSHIWDLIYDYWFHPLFFLYFRFRQVRRARYKSQCEPISNRYSIIINASIYTLCQIFTVSQYHLYFIWHSTFNKSYDMFQ